MRPIGFEPPAKRLKRSLVVGLIVGVVTVTIASALIALTSSPTTAPSALTVASAAFGLGFFAGFGLALTWPDFAPPQPKDDGDAEAGVPARLVPPVPTLHGQCTAETPAKDSESAGRA